MAKKFLLEKKTKGSFTDADGNKVSGFVKKRDNGNVSSEVTTVEPDGDKTVIKRDYKPGNEVKPLKGEPAKIKEPEIPKAKDLNSGTRIDSSITTTGDAQHNLSNGGYNNKHNSTDEPLKVGPQNGTSKNDTVNKEQIKQNEPATKKSEETNVENTEVDDSAVDNVTNQDDTVPGGAFEWFASNWKTVAIVAGAAAIIAGIVALVKGMNKTIKVRYNKVVRTLQKAQKDFTLEDRGLDMRAVMPGVGSKIFDKIAGWWNKGAKKASANGNIGIHPFCNQYKEEIGSDLRQAQEAFSKIKLAADEMEQGLDAEQNANQPQNSSVETKVYDSFQEALNSDILNESEQLNEIGAMAAISMAMTLGGLAVRAGKFVISKFKNGKPDGEGKVVQVTKQSTREICMAIINNYGNKYINMQAVYEQLGINTQSLADIDKSSCDKLGQIIKKYQKPEANKITTKQYSRIQKAYENMLKHYYNIGDGIIKNFAKYTNADNEKDENLLVSAKEKLQNMWDSQKDFYDNNFSRIVVEIVGSYSAIAYNDFIVEKVIPVFKSGIAGDADYVLDAVPKKGEYYILRQTEGQPWMKEAGEKQMGNTAIAEITGYDKDSKEISFKLIARMENNGNITIDDRGIASVEGDVNYDFYADGDGNVEEQKLGYGKWLALDPALTEWRPVTNTDTVYEYTDKKNNKYVIYASKDIRNTGDGFDKIYFCAINNGMSKVSKVVVINLASMITYDGVDDVFNKLNNKFVKNNDAEYTKRIQNDVANFKGEITQQDANDTNTVVEIINSQIGTGNESIGDVFKVSYIDPKKRLKGNLYVFATKNTSNDNDSVNSVYIAKKNDEQDGYSDTVKLNINPAILTNAYNQIFDGSDVNVKRFGLVDGQNNPIDFQKINGNQDEIEKIMSSENLKTKEVKTTEQIAKFITTMLKGMSVKDTVGVNTNSSNITDNGKKVLEYMSKLLAANVVFLQPNEQQNAQPTAPSQPNPQKPGLGLKNGEHKVTIDEFTELTSNEGQVNIICKKLGMTKGDNQSEWQAIRFSMRLEYGKDDGFVSVFVDQNKMPINRQEFEQAVGKNNAQGMYSLITKAIEYQQGKFNGTRFDVPGENGAPDKFESIQVSYSHKVVNESITTNTLVTRTFKNFPRKSYVLSESYFDLGRDTSRLSNPVVAKRFKTKANVYEYVKNNLDAKIYELTESQTYTICSYTHNKPSLMTPLYENVYVVRFDNDDNVSSIKYLGKFKIQ